VRALDQAIARIGPVHTLELRALELEEAAGRHDAALRRLDAMLSRAERRETWLKRRGDVLRRAGRASEALTAYRAAQAAIAALPAWLRESPDTAALAAELSRLAGSPGQANHSRL
jgi:predicted negative regulator of RcsB-dependent stress response